jgi:hypothetical protein
VDTKEAGAVRGGDGDTPGRVASTGCLVAVFVVLIVVLVAAPAALWCAGIACG